MVYVGIIDYGMGNLHSVAGALSALGARCFVSSSPEELARADKLVLPGVGAFPDAMRALRDAGLVEFIKEQAKLKPLLGICLGMQLLFEKSHEFGMTEGLGLLAGEVVRLTERPSKEYKIPHMGWNSLCYTKWAKDCALLYGIPEGEHVYFVHSYRAVCGEPDTLAAYSEYGDEVAAVVCSGNVFGTQFHPEKSACVGLMMLENFLKL